MAKLQALFNSWSMIFLSQRCANSTLENNKHDSKCFFKFSQKYLYTKTKRTTQTNLKYSLALGFQFRRFLWKSEGLKAKEGVPYAWKKSFLNEMMIFSIDQHAQITRTACQFAYISINFHKHTYGMHVKGATPSWVTREKKYPFD